jgi:hypothetical protein
MKVELRNLSKISPNADNPPINDAAKQARHGLP